MKTYALIALILALIILATLLISGVHAQLNWNKSQCTHLHVYGVSYEWSPCDEVTGCGIGANYLSGSYVAESLSFRRNVGYANPVWYAASPFLCYKWIGSGYNHWPDQYNDPYWQFGYLQDGPNGQWYWYQDYFDNQAIVASEIYVMAEEWFYSPLIGGYGYWDCYAWVHAPVGGGPGETGGTWG